MEALGPIIGMLILGGISGWIVGRLFRKVVVWALIALAVVLGLELIGYHVATAHLDSIMKNAESVADTTDAYGPIVWKRARYNIPFTVAFIAGLWYGITGARRN